MLGLAFRQAQGSEYSRGLRVDPEQRFFTPPSKAVRSTELTPKSWRHRMGQFEQRFSRMKWIANVGA